MREPLALIAPSYTKRIEIIALIPISTRTFLSFFARNFACLKSKILEILCGNASRIFFVDFDCENCMENRNANIWKLSRRAKKVAGSFQPKSYFQLAETTHNVEILCRFAFVEYFSWCDCANRRHAIIAGFSFQEALFSRRKFIFSGENSVRFAATSHGGKPLYETSLAQRKT